MSTIKKERRNGRTPSPRSNSSKRRSNSRRMLSAGCHAYSGAEGWVLSASFFTGSFVAGSFMTNLLHRLGLHCRLEPVYYLDACQPDRHLCGVKVCSWAGFGEIYWCERRTACSLLLHRAERTTFPSMTIAETAALAVEADRPPRLTRQPLPDSHQEFQPWRAGSGSRGPWPAG